MVKNTSLKNYKNYKNIPQYFVIIYSTNYKLFTI